MICCRNPFEDNPYRRYQMAWYISNEIESITHHQTGGVSYFHMEEQERRFFMPSCHAVGAKEALYHGALRVRF